MNDVVAPASEPASFTARKAEQLRVERANQPEQPAPAPRQPEQDTDLGDQTPQPDMGSADVEEDDSQGLYADGEDAEYEDDAEDPDGTPSDESDTDYEADDVNWEKRYKDLQSETQAVRENRGEMEQEHAESMSQHLKLRFDLEDRLSEATQRAEFLRNTMSGNAQQYQNIDWSRVPPDKVQEVQAQAQQAFQLQQQADTAYDQIMGQVNDTKTKVKQREAAIAKTRLVRTIPNWGNETYGELREFAVNSGMPANMFNEITDPVIIEWAYAAKQIREAGSKGVQSVTKTRKAQPPRGKGARKGPRDERGRYATKKVEPNQRGSFADKHRHRLAMERDGR
jgi:hypothetical protein